mmetsp:Transcript_27081/g.64321  ORF Transcript_27081/g.64321 Transcript_27081/m.64321 type:complete len:137 (+) Transcript_27081:39-449(+)
MAAATGRKKRETDVDDDKLVFETSQDVEVIPTFEGMGLRDDLLRGVYAYGFEKPSAIQQRAIIPMISQRDVIAQAQSGTGKTAMISVSSLQARSKPSFPADAGTVHRHPCSGDSGVDHEPYTRVGRSNTESSACHR